MLAIVGLGNPGSLYAGTRHNVGFMIVDALADRFAIHFSTHPGECLIAEASEGKTEVILVKPLTYMNNSGVAVKNIIEEYRLSLDQCIVVVDDFHLPLGKLRLRKEGRSGGHNGLYSIIYHLRSEGFARLRCGIASPLMPLHKKNMADFVLSPFGTDEKTTVHGMIDSACETLVSVVTHGFEEAMRRLSLH